MPTICSCVPPTSTSTVTASRATTRSSIAGTWLSAMRLSIPRDAFWETENVTIYDSEITGEYLGWHSRNLKLVRCIINGTQPLCYASGLVMEDCVMGDECDLAFEDSDFNATVKSAIVSVKNPRSGHLKALAIGEIIKDKNVLAPDDCVIETEV